MAKRGTVSQHDRGQKHLNQHDDAFEYPGRAAHQYRAHIVGGENNQWIELGQQMRSNTGSRRVGNGTEDASTVPEKSSKGRKSILVTREVSVKVEGRAPSLAEEGSDFGGKLRRSGTW